MGRAQNQYVNEPPLQCEQGRSLASLADMSYDQHEDRVQALLAERATQAKGELYAASAVETHKAFVNDVLRNDGSRVLTEEHLLQVRGRPASKTRSMVEPAAELRPALTVAPSIRPFDQRHLLDT